jgi:glycine cleavage system H protein
MSFTWYKVKGEEIKDSDKVIFVTIEEKRYGIKKPAFKSLLEGLETWSYDKVRDEVLLKFRSQLPKNNTKAMVIYDRGFDSFERYAEVLNIFSFPFQYSFKDQPFLTIVQVNKDGDAYFNFKGKRIKLAKGKSYISWSFDDKRLTKTIIKNHGFYDKKQFKLMEKDLLYTKDHVWLKKDGKNYDSGVTDFIDWKYGEVQDITLPEKNTFFKKGETVGEIKTKNKTFKIVAPIDGKITEVNELLKETPNIINNSSSDNGWIFKIKPNDKIDTKEFMDYKTYQAYEDDL